MSQIKKLINREWIRFFLSSEVALLSLLTIGNLISGFQRDNVSNYEVLLNYLIELPSFFIQITPVSCLIASLFSINKLKNRNELTAIFAAGYSRRAFLLNLIQISFFVALFQFVMSSYINPYVKSKRYDLLSDSITKFRRLQSQGLSSNTGKVWYKNSQYFLSFQKFDKKSNTLFNVDIFKYDTNYKLKVIYKFKELKYDSLNDKWIPNNPIEYDNLNNLSFPLLKYDIKYFDLIETLSDFKQIEADITTLNFLSLFNYIKQLNNSGINTGEYLVIFLRHFSDSIICIIFTLLAAIPIFNPNRRNSSFGKSAGFVFVFTILYWLIQNYSIELGKNLKISAYLACFFVPSLFLVTILTVFYKNRKLA